MALGVQELGTAAVIRIGTTATPATVIGGLVTWSWVGDSGTTDRKYYDGTAASTAVGDTIRTVSLTIDNMDGDAGQLILHDALDSKAIIWVKVLPGGVNGQIVPVRVSHAEVAGPDVSAFNTGAFTLNQAGTPVDVGLGLGG